MQFCIKQHVLHWTQPIQSMRNHAHHIAHAYDDVTAYDHVIAHLSTDVTPFSIKNPGPFWDTFTKFENHGPFWDTFTKVSQNGPFPMCRFTLTKSQFGPRVGFSSFEFTSSLYKTIVTQNSKLKVLFSCDYDLKCRS